MYCILHRILESNRYFNNMELGLFTDAGFEIPDLFVVGYALDYNEYFRDLNVSFISIYLMNSTVVQFHFSFKS